MFTISFFVSKEHEQEGEGKTPLPAILVAAAMTGVKQKVAGQYAEHVSTAAYRNTFYIIAISHTTTKKHYYIYRLNHGRGPLTYKKVEWSMSMSEILSTKQKHEFGRGIIRE